MLIYDSKKYCVLKMKHCEVWDEKYCILKEKYDRLSQNTRKKHKIYFYGYLIVTAITDTVFCLYLYNN
jgi:hypothetical protein